MAIEDLFVFFRLLKMMAKLLTQRLRFSVVSVDFVGRRLDLRYHQRHCCHHPMLSVLIFGRSGSGRLRAHSVKNVGVDGLVA